METEYLIYQVSDGKKMYLTDLGDDSPMGGIGFQSCADGLVPDGAGTCPTREDAVKVISYLRAAIGTYRDHFGIEERQLREGADK
ncbi:hypothetical protein K5S02_07460 [Klebsiella sp. M581]|uniref:hypothetical protein n=1 Tax=unclassified Klebsiella TaxID=2608929 RepID=UPI001C8DE578|nr:MULTISPECIES: hypothetical protein [unclassified Klebsiella]MBY0738157.1 hypothetical protein [Klebsiella sp. M589]MBY0747697.1 hypothetical protein [Klebsiella sp. M581]